MKNGPKRSILVDINLHTFVAKNCQPKRNGTREHVNGFYFRKRCFHGQPTSFVHCLKRLISQCTSCCPFSAGLISNIRVGDKFNATTFDSTDYAECWNQANDASGAGLGAGDTKTFNCFETRLGRYVAINFQNPGGGVLQLCEVQIFSDIGNCFHIYLLTMFEQIAK